jgi:hypothetical protein
MTGVATAIAGAAIVGGVVSNNASKRAVSAQADANDKAAQQLAASTAAARQDLFKLYPAAQQNMQQGYQGALDVFKNTLPQQASTFQAGNVAAQNQLLAGMPQYQNAILGAPVDYSKFQATQLQQPDFSFANQQLQYTDPYAPAPAGPPLTNHPQYGQIAQGAPQGPTSNGAGYSQRGFNYNDLLSGGFR